jgi:Fic family protein
MPIYIHQLPNWPKFQWNQAALTVPLAALRHRQGRFLGRMEALGFPLRSEAMLQTLTEDVVKSSEIEGHMLDKEQVRSSIARRLGIEIGALTPADRDVEGMVDMMLDATQEYDEPLTGERLFAWHAALFPAGRSGMHKITVAAWRDDSSGPMQVVSGALGKERVHYEAPPAARVPHEMQDFLDWFETRHDIDPVLKAGIAHLWFVTIHPFEDGNGRIARAVADMALARSDGSPQRFYSMSAQIRQERNAYYAMLEATQKGDLDITSWLEWFFACLDRALSGAESTLVDVFRKAEFWKRHAGAAFNDRQRDILNRLLDRFEGKLTTSKYAIIEKTSPDTALRDITDLVERGIFRKDAGRGRSTSYSLAGD